MHTHFSANIMFVAWPGDLQHIKIKPSAQFRKSSGQDWPKKKEKKKNKVLLHVDAVVQNGR